MTPEQRSVAATIGLDSCRVLLFGSTLFVSTRVEDDESCLRALKGNLVCRMHVNNNLQVFDIATREEML